MVARREGFQRVYDIAENVLKQLDPPFDFLARSPPAADLRLRFITDSVRALGVTQAAWIADYYRLKSAVTDDELAPLLDNGEVLATIVQGWDKPAYVHRNHADALQNAKLGRLRATHTALLSPFDPVVWDRARARSMFDFDYSLECYMPQPRRRYGYFVLPILHRGRLVGRLDAKAHRAGSQFEIRAFFLEPKVNVDPSLLASVARAMTATARWHGTPEVRVGCTQSAKLTNALRVALLAAR